MNKKIKEIEDKLPKDCCSLCSHLTLDGPEWFFKYEIKVSLKTAHLTRKTIASISKPITTTWLPLI